MALFLHDRSIYAPVVLYDVLISDLSSSEPDNRSYAMAPPYLDGSMSLRDLQVMYLEYAIPISQHPSALNPDRPPCIREDSSSSSSSSSGQTTGC